MANEVANLTLAITGKDDASRALEAVGQATQALQQILQALGGVAQSSGQGIQQLGAAGQASQSGLSGLAGAAQSGSAGLQQMGGATQGVLPGFETLGSTVQASLPGFDQLGASAASSAGGLDSAGASAGSAGGGFEQLGTGAADAGSGLQDLSGSASDASSAAQDAGSSASDAGSGFDALGSGAELANEGLNSAAAGAAALGVNLQPVAAAGSELTGVMGSLSGGLQNVAMAAGLAVVAIAGIGAAIIGDVLSSTAQWADQLGDLSAISGFTADSLAGLQIRIEQVGGSLNDFAGAFSYVSRQFETMALDAEQAGEAAASAAEDQAARSSAAAAGAAQQLADLQHSTAQSISDAQEDLAQAFADTQAAIVEATEREAQALDDLAAKHAETIAKIQQDIVDLTQNYNQNEEDRLARLTESVEERKAREEAAAEGRAFSHGQSLERIAQRESDANERMAAAQQKLAAAKTDSERASARAAIASAQDALEAVALAKKQEIDQYNFATQQALEADARKDAADKAKFEREQARAKEAYDKKLAALQESLVREDQEYQKAVAKEQARTEDQIATLQARYARQEAETAKHIQRTEDQFARSAARIGQSMAGATSGGGGGGGAKESPFEQELRKMLEFAGLTADQINQRIGSITSGQMTVAQILPELADGFRNQAEAAAANGQEINQMGQVYRLFGRGASADLLAVLQQGGDAFREDTDLARHFGLALGDEGSAKVANYIKAQADLNAAMRGLKVTLGVELMPIFTEWLTKLTEWVTGNRDKVVDFFRDVGAKAKEFGEFLYANKDEILDFFKDMLPAIQTVVTEVAEFAAAFQEHWPEISAAISFTWSIVKPIFDQIEVAIKTVGLVMDLLSGDWDGAWTKLKDIATIQLGVILKVFDPFIKLPLTIIKAFTDADWGAIWSGITSAFSTGWTALSTEAGTQIGNIATAIGNLPSTIAGYLPGMFTAGGNLITSLFNGIMGGMGTVLGWAAGLPGDMYNQVTAGLSTLFTLGQNILMSVYNGAVGVGNNLLTYFANLPGLLQTAFGDGFDFLWNAFKGAINGIINGWNKLQFKIPGFDPPGPGPTFPGFTLGVPPIPTLMGGMWEVPGSRSSDHFPALLAGGEMVVPAAQADVLRKGGGGFQVNFNGPIQVINKDGQVDSRKALNDVSFALHNYFRRAGGVLIPA